MKIKLQDYCLVSNDFIKALNDYGIPKHFIETIPAEKLANVGFIKGYESGNESEHTLKESNYDLINSIQDFLNSEIEIQ